MLFESVGSCGYTEWLSYQTMENDMTMARLWQILAMHTWDVNATIRIYLQPAWVNDFKFMDSPENPSWGRA